MFSLSSDGRPVFVQLSANALYSHVILSSLVTLLGKLI